MWPGTDEKINERVRAALQQRKARKVSETQLSAAIKSALAYLPGLLLWRNNTGKLQDRNGRWVTFGLGVGSADRVGLVDGRFFALEVKLPGEKPTKEQTCWHQCVRNVGGFCRCGESVEEAVLAVSRCRRGDKF